MRILLEHRTQYSYQAPARAAIQVLRLSPRPFEGQYIVKWRINVEPDCHLRPSTDAFGNIVHVFSLDGPISQLAIEVKGEVETFDMAGLVHSAHEPLPKEIFLRETDLTRTDAPLRAFAEKIIAPKRYTLDSLHDLMNALREKIIFSVGETHVTTTAAEAFAHGNGVCQDFAHIFIAAARFRGIPARYVSGYFQRSDGVVEQAAGHAWCEAYIEDLGWVGFDPANGICPDGHHIRVAVGLDYLSAAPVRGNRTGGSGEHLSVTLKVGDGQAQRFQSPDPSQIRAG